MLLTSKIALNFTSWPQEIILLISQNKIWILCKNDNLALPSFLSFFSFTSSLLHLPYPSLSLSLFYVEEDKEENKGRGQDSGGLLCVIFCCQEGEEREIIFIFSKVLFWSRINILFILLYNKYFILFDNKIIVINMKIISKIEKKKVE